MSKTLATKQYGDWKMLHPNGTLMCRTGDKRANWYLSRGIAKIVDDNTIQLLFEPAGQGESHPFLLEAKDNACVVCGSTEGLNRHHVVPYQYRKHFPVDQKANSSYDVLPICLEHHEEYELHAQAFSRQLGDEYGIEAHPRPIMTAEMKMEQHATADARSIIMYSHLISPERRELLLSRLEAYRKAFNRPNETIEETALRPKPIAVMPHNHGKLMVEKLLELGRLQEFIQQWRHHFVTTMNPQFLSESWELDYVKVR